MTAALRAATRGEVRAPGGAARRRGAQWARRSRRESSASTGRSLAVQLTRNFERKNLAK